MTETKKYRRRVSDERVDRITYLTGEHPKRVRAVLEADAEVMEGVYVHVQYNPHTRKDVAYLEKRNGCVVKTIETFESLEQFHAEWEEV